MQEGAYRTDEILGGLIDEFSATNKPIKVNFRELVSWVKYGERFTHMLHPYPAKLLSHIPHFFLQNDILSQRGDLVMDPFCGSGTVPLESILSDRRAIGFDSNPLAQFIASVKVTPIEEPKLRSSIKKIEKHYNAIAPEIPDVVNIEYWYSDKNIKGLGKLRASILAIEDESVRNFMQSCLSVSVRKLSYADPRVSVPVRLNPNKKQYDKNKKEKIRTRIKWIDKTDPLSVFFDVYEQNRQRMAKLVSTIGLDTNAKIYLSDARELKIIKKNNTRKLSRNSVQLIITSPPYAGAQKYIRSSGLSLGWLGLACANELRPLEQKSIGREHYSKHEYIEATKTGIYDADKVLAEVYKSNPLRSHIAANYLLEMESACKRMIEVLKPNGYVVLVIGNNQVCGHEFQTKEYLKEIYLANGLSLVLELVDDIHSRGLMTKRNKTASLIASESVLIFKKQGNA